MAPLDFPVEEGPTPEQHRVWNRLSHGACPMGGCKGDWKTDRPFYARCTVDPSHFFLKEHLMAGRADPIIETEARETS